MRNNKPRLVSIWRVVLAAIFAAGAGSCFTGAFITHDGGAEFWGVIFGLALILTYGDHDDEQ